MELKLDIEEVEFDEELAKKNVEENGHLFHELSLEDGIGKDIEIDESEVE